MNNITPSLFKHFPWDSVLANNESETVARNIMVILARTSNTFRYLTWDEYRIERLKDGEFQECEKMYFEKVSYLANGNKNQITAFSKRWEEAINQ